MKRILVGIVVAMMALGAIYGAAAVLGVGGVDRLSGDSQFVSNLECSICTTPTPVP